MCVHHGYLPTDRRERINNQAEHQQRMGKIRYPEPYVGQGSWLLDSSPNLYQLSKAIHPHLIVLPTRTHAIVA